MKLPGERCTRCGSSEFLSHDFPERSAYRDLVQRCATAIEVQDTIYRPSNWMEIILALRIRVGSTEHILKMLEKRLVDAWRVNSIQGIGGNWLDSFRPGHLVQVMHGHLTTSPLVIQMLVLQAIEQELPDIREQAGAQTTMQASSSHTESSSSTNGSAQEFVRTALNLGTDERFASLASEPSALHEVARDLGISKTHARKLVRRVRDSVHGQKEDRRTPKELGRPRSDEKLNTRKTKCRTVIAQILHVRPETGRTAMWRLCKNSMLWLSKHDKEWLDANLPLKNRTIKSQG